MVHTVKSKLSSVQQFISKHRKAITRTFVTGFIVFVAVVVAMNMIVDSNKQYILKSGNAKHVRVGLVLGAGINNKGKPYKELQARLDVAADALNGGQVDKLILSGDNRFLDYNEPDAMKQYMIDIKHVDPTKLQPDYAGRSTYESCERLTKVFNVHETIIYSAGSHLPRAIYLCRHFGITAYGVSSNVEANNSTRREILARVKAVLNTHQIGSAHTVLGEPISI